MGQRAHVPLPLVYQPDQIPTAGRIAATAFGATGEALVTVSDQVRESMVGRLHVVGLSETTRPVIEATLAGLLALLKRHLDGRNYLFGGRHYAGKGAPNPGPVRAHVKPQEWRPVRGMGRVASHPDAYVKLTGHRFVFALERG